MDKLKKVGKVLGIFIIIICLTVVTVILGFNVYQRVSYREFYAVSEKEFLIPGLSDGFVPQGITYVEDESKYLVCGYMADGTASRIYKFDDKQGENPSKDFVQLIKSDGKPDLAHAGGVAVYGDFVYMATGEEINVYSLKAVLDDKNDTVKTIGTFDPQTGPAFVHVEDGYLYVGEFYIAEDYETPKSHHMETDSGDFNQAVMTVFKLDETKELGLEDKIPELAYSITDNAQGMCFVDGNILISTSYGLSTSHVKVYSNPVKLPLSENANRDRTFITSDSHAIPLYYLDSAHLEKDWTLAPMAEELLLKDDKVYVMCESASTKYKFGNFTGGRYCYSFNP